MAKKTSLVPTDKKALVPGRVLAGTSIVPLAVYHVRDRHPSGTGPWSGEADKVSWIDPTTGLACIIRRDKEGALHGYVAVGSGHPFYGLSADALPHEPGIVVHGGIDYAMPCNPSEPESVSVCHVRVPKLARTAARGSAPHYETTAAALQETLADMPDEPWWFGFGADHSYDYVPARDRNVPLGQENGRIYRDERYMARETTRLAGQLHAIGTGAPMPLMEGPPPPMGLDPYEPRS